MKRTLLALGLIACAALGNAQAWSEAEGSSILRTSPISLPNLYDRPAIFFLGRPAKVLPPSYSFIYPYGKVVAVEHSGLMTSEFRPLDKRGRQIYARTTSLHVISSIDPRLNALQSRKSGAKHRRE